MKKIALFLAAALSFSFAQAQTGPKFGVKGGVTYSNLSGNFERESTVENKFGFTGGVTANFPISSDGFLSIQPELLYTQKGYQYRDEKFTVGGIDYKRKGDVNYNYLDLPIMLRVNAGGLFFEGGPQVSYLLGIRDNTEEKIGDRSNETYRRVSKDNLAEIEIGYGAGLGYQTSNGLSLGIRYNGSINSLAKNDGDELANSRHSVFMATVGFMLPFGK